MDEVQKRVRRLSKQLYDLLGAKPVRLQTGRLKGVKNEWGIYRIYTARSSKTLYVGKSKRLHSRLRVDLLSSGGAHTFKTKLQKAGKSLTDVLGFLQNCHVQWLHMSKDEVTTLEHFAIASLDPEWND